MQTVATKMVSLCDANWFYWLCVILCFGEQQLSEVLPNSLGSRSVGCQDSIWTVLSHS
jgi:hypothetical protein